MRLPDTAFAALPGDLIRQAAVLHTLFNLMAGVAICFADRLGILVTRLIPEPKTNESELPRLDSRLLEHPPLALNAALRECLGLFDAAQIYVNESVAMLKKGTFAPAKRFHTLQQTNNLFETRSQIAHYLDRIDEEALTAEDRTLKDALEDLAREFTFILRTVSRDLPQEVKNLLGKENLQSKEILPIIEEATQRWTQQLALATRMFIQRQPDLVASILRLKQETSQWLVQTRREHPNFPTAFHEIMDDFQQLNRRLGAIAHAYNHAVSPDGE